MMGDRRHSRRGFSLVELLIALAVGAMVMMLCARLAGAITGAVRRVDNAGQVTMLQANGLRWLQLRLRAARLPEKERPFLGTPRTVVFDALAASVGAPQAPTRVELSVQQDEMSGLVDGSRRIVLRRNVRHLEIDYLISRGLNALWLPEWSSDRGLPLAIRFRMWRLAPPSKVDTVLVTVGVIL